MVGGPYLTYVTQSANYPLIIKVNTYQYQIVVKAEVQLQLN